MKTICAGVLSFVSLINLTTAQVREPETFSIAHVTVIDVATGKERSDQTVTMRSGRIVSVADDVTAPPSSPEDASAGKTMDAHGEFLIPGLWDMHVHVQELADLPLYLANGVTGVRMMSGEKDTGRGVLNWRVRRCRRRLLWAARSWTAIRRCGRDRSW